MSKSWASEIIYSQVEPPSQSQFKPLRREGCTQPPHPIRLQSLYLSGKLCRTDREGSRIFCRVYIHRRETGREMPKRLILYFSWGDKIHWLRWARQGDQKLEQNGESGPRQVLVNIQSCHQHQSGKSWPSYTYCLLPWNEQLVYQNLYFIGNKLGQTKMGRLGAGEHTNSFRRRLNSVSQGRPRVRTLLITL